MSKVIKFLATTLGTVVLTSSLASVNVQASPAKPLSALWVDQVGSTKYGGFEYTKGLSSTKYDHGGTELVVYTYERGYANPSLRFAKLNGTLLKQCDSQAIDENGDSIIDGFFIGWDASGYENGTFTYQATSTNSPWNTLSTSIYIK